MEISELNRLVQRLRSEIDAVKKQVPSVTTKWGYLLATGETFPDFESCSPYQCYTTFSILFGVDASFQNLALMWDTLKGTL